MTTRLDSAGKSPITLYYLGYYPTTRVWSVSCLSINGRVLGGLRLSNRRFYRVAPGGAGVPFLREKSWNNDNIFNMTILATNTVKTDDIWKFFPKQMV